MYSFILCLITVREGTKHVAKLNTLGCPLSKADRGPNKVLCFLQSPTSSVEDPLPDSWLENNNNDESSTGHHSPVQPMILVNIFTPVTLSSENRRVYFVLFIPIFCLLHFFVCPIGSS